jgi:hypothetical protein
MPASNKIKQYLLLPGNDNMCMALGCRINQPNLEFEFIIFICNNQQLKIATLILTIN